MQYERPFNFHQHGLATSRRQRQDHNGGIDWTCLTYAPEFFVVYTVRLIVSKHPSYKMDFLQGPKIGAAIPHRSAVTSLSYHENGGHLFAATSADSKLYLINAQDGKCDRPAFKCEKEGISSVSST